MSDQVNEELGGNEGNLRSVLDQAWYNVRHHDRQRMRQVHAYLLLVAGWMALVAFNVKDAALLPASSILILYGWMVMQAALRYKERIVRDMRVVYHIHDHLLVSDSDTKIVSIFKDYRQPHGAKKPPKDSTRLLLLVLNLINSFVFGWMIADWRESAMFGVGLVR